MRYSIMFCFAVFVSATAVAQDVDTYLLPVVAQSAPGAFGSVWTTDLTIHNGSSPAITLHAPTCLPILTSCTPFPIVLGEGETVMPQVYPRESSQGVLIDVLQPHPGLAMELRVRDLSRESQTWGTELPIVSTNKFQILIRLIDIPTDSRFRTTLRIYSLNAGAAHVRVMPLNGRSILAEQTVTLQGFAAPWYAQVEPFPPGLVDDRVRVEIEPVQPTDLRLWAFVTITNNATQFVTAVTPQP